MKKEIQAVLTNLKMTEPTLIQEKTRTPILNGASCIALAKTGTGKTLAYALPSLEKVAQGKPNSLVIIAPTTELAVQIRHAINHFIQALKLTGITLVGAGNRQRQEDNLKEAPRSCGCNSRQVFDFFSAGRIKIDQIRTLVIDEADDVLEFNKMELLSSLGQNMTPDSQILLFGATESEITQQAPEIFARQFEKIDVRPDQKTTVKNYFLQIDNAHKIDFIQRLLRLDGFKGILFLIPIKL
ncbi:DEAD/DEAH box helicase [Lactobacillus sp. R2/2]|nr:DEAD/DEAH box helicase [Lactobacillus sp. R2/2]